MTVQLQHRLSYITEKVVVAIAMRDALKLGCNRPDEGILLVRHPYPHRLVQGLSPLTGQSNQSPPLLGCTRQQGLRTPHPLAHQLAHHVEGFMAEWRFLKLPVHFLNVFSP